MKTKVKVYDVMTHKPVTASQDTTLIDCAKKMRDSKIGSLLIKEGKMIVGIITEDDIVRKVVAENMDAKTTKVSEVMLTKLITISPDKDIYEAIKKMGEQGIKQLPVTEDGKLVGILTWKDVLTVQPQLFDVFIEKTHVDKGAIREHSVRGRCEACGCIKELNEIKGQLICDECAEDID